jgi:hypothetical protein
MIWTGSGKKELTGDVRNVWLGWRGDRLNLAGGGRVVMGMAKDIKVWRYYIPGENSVFGWGVFLLDSSGMFTAVTDYGNYAYQWLCTGHDDFRGFVIGLARGCPDYLLSKISQLIYDGDRTLEHVKEHILEYRRDGDYTKEFARKEWELLGDCNDLDSEYDFYDWMQNTEIQDPWELSCSDYPKCARHFAERLVPRLAKILERELGMVEQAG